MSRRLRRALALLAGAAVLGGCDGVVDGGDSMEGVNFAYSGAMAGTFESAGTITAAPGELPDLASFAMAQRDSIGGLLLGSFRRTGEGRGDLFILQVRDDEPGTFTCALVTDGPSCYGHLFVGIEANQGTLAADAVYGISAGSVALTRVGPGRLEGTFDLTLRDLADPATTVTVGDGTVDVPLVQGVFGASFGCLVVRLEEGPDAPCD